LEQATEKKRIRREADIQGHLLGEEEEEAKEKKEKSTTTANPLAFWWDSTEKPDSKKQPTPGEKLLREDFQVAQAYNYLKAWKAMNQFKQAPGGGAPAETR
jgi:hypothetical protein